MDYNLNIRREIRRSLLKNYQVAQAMGKSLSWFYTKLQQPLTEQEAAKFFEAINSLKSEMEPGNE